MPVMLRRSAKPPDFCFAFMLCYLEIFADGPNPFVFRTFCVRLEGGGSVRVWRGRDFIREQRVASGVREEKKRDEERRDNLSRSFVHSHFSLHSGYLMLLEMDANHTWQAAGRIRAEVY